MPQAVPPMQHVRAEDLICRNAFKKRTEERRISSPNSTRSPSVLHRGFEAIQVRGQLLGTGGKIDAHSCCRKVSDERSSTVLMASNVLFYSGLATLAAGVGMARRGCGLCTEDGVYLFSNVTRTWK